MKFTAEHVCLYTISYVSGTFEVTKSHKAEIVVFWMIEVW